MNRCAVTTVARYLTVIRPGLGHSLLNINNAVCLKQLGQAFELPISVQLFGNHKATLGGQYDAFKGVITG